MPEFVLFLAGLLLAVGSFICLVAESDYKNSFRCAVPAILLIAWLVIASLNYNRDVRVEKLPVTTYVDSSGAKTYYYFNKNKNSLVNIFGISNGSSSKTDDNKTSLPEGQDFIYLVSYKRSFSCWVFFGMFSDNVDIYTSLQDNEKIKSIYETSKVEK